ncbi:MAG: hypothetical protein M3Q39_00935 [Actinomycetota bacterium]|nr:hypothetical protein [Actinomycetota bacterium]
MSAAPFRRVRRPCSWCTKVVETQSKVERPMCRSCRAKRRNLDKGRRLTQERARRQWSAEEYAFDNRLDTEGPC